MAEASLSFDPNSAFVIAEVAQIIQKNSAGLAPDGRVNLGGGLVIHDLDRIGDTQDSGSNPHSADIEPNDARDAPLAMPPGEVHTYTVDRRPIIPWAILVGLFVTLVAVTFWLKLATRQR